MSKTRVKRAAETVRAPADRAEAEAMLGRIGELTRDLAMRQAALDEEVAAAKLEAERAAAQPQAELADLTRGLQLWAEANREALTDGGRTQTVRLASGEVGWRRRPPRVTVTNGDAVVELMLSQGLERFVRTKRELDRERMLAEPAAAGAVPGVKIGSAGEDFVVTPVSLEMVGS